MDPSSDNLEAGSVEFFKHFCDDTITKARYAKLSLVHTIDNATQPRQICGSSGQSATDPSEITIAYLAHTPVKLSVEPLINYMATEKRR